MHKGFMYYIVIVPPTGSIISLISNTAYETNRLVEYYTRLGCLVNAEGVN